LGLLLPFNPSSLTQIILFHKIKNKKKTISYKRRASMKKAKEQGKVYYYTLKYSNEGVTLRNWRDDQE
jgi:hypothetical protein